MDIEDILETSQKLRNGILRILFSHDQIMTRLLKSSHPIIDSSFRIEHFFVAAALASLVLSGCAPTGTRAELKPRDSSIAGKAVLDISTIPSGANVTMTTSASRRWDGARTPATFVVDPTLDIILEITLDGYRPVVHEVEKKAMQPGKALSLFFDLEQIR